MRKLAIKRGSSFTWGATYKRNGTPESIDAFTITSQVRDQAGVLVGTLTVTKLPGETGKYTLSANTATWPVGTHYCDVKYTNGSDIAFTDTFAVVVERSQTE